MLNTILSLCNSALSIGKGLSFGLDSIFDMGECSVVNVKPLTFSKVSDLT